MWADYFFTSFLSYYNYVFQSFANFHCSTFYKILTFKYFIFKVRYLKKSGNYSAPNILVQRIRGMIGLVCDVSIVLESA